MTETVKVTKMEPTVNNPTSGGTVPRIMVFRPTWEEFKDFNKYILYMESCGAHKAGLAKVVPPPEWKPRKAGYDTDEIGNIKIPAPISQVVTGKQGVYQQLNIQKAKMTVKEFQKVAESDRYCTPRHFDYEDLERKYWKNITYVSPIYGADVAGTLTDKDVKEWNINKLGSILDLVNEDYGIRIDGVNTAYLYFGMWKTSFAWHTEDMDLYSINYLHFGAPKSWYSVPPEHGRRLERMANGFFPSNYKECPAYLRHKMFVISPQILKMYSIPYNKITQEPGEFMVTFPYGYHAGFNHGFNCAESTNFASPRWVEYGKRAVQCHCRNDMVKISMDTFVKRFQPDRYELWIQGQDVGPHPEDMSRQSAAAPPTIDDILCNKNNTIIPDGFFNQKKHKRHPIHKKAKDVEPEEPCQTPPPDESSTKHKIDSGTKRKPSKQIKLEVVAPKEEPNFDDVSAGSALLNLQTGPPVLEAQNYTVPRLGEVPSKPPVLVPIMKELEGQRRQPHDAAPILSPIADEQSSNREEKKAVGLSVAGNANSALADEPSCSYRPLSSEQAPHWLQAVSVTLQSDKCTFEHEAEYNYFCGQAEPYCSVCSLLFSPRLRHTDFATPEWKVRSPVQIVSSPVHLEEHIFAWHLRAGAYEELPLTKDQTGQKISTLLRCSCCHVCVHASCYGVPESSSPFQWLCRRCQAGDRHASCCLCTLRGGALKPTNDNRWAHVTCALAIPEVYFDDTVQREPVNVRFVLKERARLTCAHCRQPRGVNIQCSADRCSQAFHVSCGHMAGVKSRPAEFPTALSSTCTRHRSSDLCIGHFVWARYHNNRYYRAKISSIDDVVFYWVDFSDGSTSKDTYPEDIVNYRCKEHGPPPVGAAVHVLWTDGKAYDGTFRGTVAKKMYTVEFEDGTQLTLEKEYVYDLDNGLPKKVQLRLGPVAVPK